MNAVSSREVDEGLRDLERITRYHDKVVADYRRRERRSKLWMVIVGIGLMLATLAMLLGR